MEYWMMKREFIYEALVPHLEDALELLNMPCEGISGIEEIVRNGRHVFHITCRCQKEEQLCLSHIKVCKDMSFSDQNYIKMMAPHPEFPDNMYFFFEFDENINFKLILIIPKQRKLELNLSDDVFSIFASRNSKTGTMWNFEVTKTGDSESFDIGSRERKKLWIEKELAPYVEALRNKLLGFDKYVINRITEEICNADYSVLKVGLKLRSEINDVSTHKVEVIFSDDTLSKKVKIYYDESQETHLSKSVSQIPTDTIDCSSAADISLRNVTVDLHNRDRDFKLEFTDNSNKLVALIRTEHFEGFRFRCERFEKYMTQNEKHPLEWKLEITRIDFYKFGASEELTECLVLSGNELKQETLPVITIKTKDDYLKKIFIHNLLGCCSEKNKRLVRLGKYIFQWDLKDFWVYGLHAVCCGQQWLWTDNEGRYCEPPNNSDTKYDDLFQDFEPTSILYFAEAIKGNFCSEFFKTIRKPRLAQVILALVLAEPIRNWETLLYNDYFSNRPLMAICCPNVVKQYHPMVPKGSFRDKKTSIYGNDVSRKMWLECLAEVFEDDIVACTIYRYHLVLPNLNNVTFRNCYLQQRKQAICKRFSSDDSDIFALFPMFLLRNAE